MYALSLIKIIQCLTLIMFQVCTMERISFFLRFLTGTMLPTDGIADGLIICCGVVKGVTFGLDDLF